MDAENLSLEVLCVHHSLANFSSGHEASDKAAVQLQELVRIRDHGDYYVVVAVTPDHEVVGIVSAVDVRLVDPEGNNELWLYYNLMAVRHDFQRSEVINLLLAEIDMIRDRRFALNDDYLGELASPLAFAGENATGLSRLLARRNFQPLETDPTRWWYRRRESQDDRDAE